MNDLQIFNHNRFGQIRTIIRDGEVWFVAMDVAEILEYSETAAMTRGLDEDETAKIKSADCAGLINQFGNNDLTIINESGMYHAVLVSRKPEAKVFRKWVTSEVLPAIRKTGEYKPLTVEQKIRAFYRRVQESRDVHKDFQCRDLDMGLIPVVSRMSIIHIVF